MSWRKNAFSYILWAIYLTGIGAAFIWFGIQAAGVMGLTNPFLIIPVIVLIFILTIMLIHVISRRLHPLSASVEKAAEILLIIVLLAVGILLRAVNMSYAGENADYFGMAMVSEGSGVPVIVHGATYCYLQLLHILYLIIGNKWIAGIVLQICLQTAGSLISYLGIRKIAGILPAVLALAFQLLVPTEILSGLTYSPEMLYRCLYYTAFLMLAICFQKYGNSCSGGSGQNTGWGKGSGFRECLYFFLTGCCIGLVSYLDIAGVTLILITICAIGYRDDSLLLSETHLKKARYSRLLFILPGTLSAFLVCLLTDAYLSGKLLTGIIKAWLTIYRPGEISYDFWFNRLDNYLLCFILLLLLSIGIFSFWCRKKIEKMRIWILLMMGLAILQILQMTTDYMTAGGLFLVFCTVMSGMAITEGLHYEHTSKKETSSYPDLYVRPRGQKGAKMETNNAITDQTAMQNENAQTEQTHSDQAMEETAQDIPAANKINYIENPLPLPKKHVKKTMDYEFVPDPSQMNYDLEIPTYDDFDIE